MSRQTKIILLIAVGISLVSCCIAAIGMVFLFNQAITWDPNRTASIGKQIADFDLPSDYTIKGGTNVLGIIGIRITNKSGKNTIWLNQGKTKGTSPDAYLRSVTAVNYRGVEWKAVQTKSVTIRGEETSLTIYTGTGPDGHRYHAWACAFTGKGGPAKLIIAAPEETWDEDAMQAFADSIH